MTYDTFLTSLAHQEPPTGLSEPLLALWLCKKDRWQDSHNVAQDLHTPTGSWIHALLHVIEGDQGNGDYWFAKARKPSHGPKDIDALWDEIATVVLAS